MKKLLVIPAIIFLYSCSKNKPSNITLRGNATLKYKVDSVETLYTGDAGTPNRKGVIAWKHLANGSSGTTYFIQALKGLNDLIGMGIITDSLQSGQSYVGEGQFTFVVFKGQKYAITDSSQVFNISITRYYSGFIDGSFSGKLYTFNPQTSITDSISVTEGEFKNVRVIY